MLTVGHPFSDLAYLLIGYYRKDFKPLPGMPSLQEAQQIYCEAAGQPWPLPGFDFAIAFSNFRSAIIAQGIAARYYQKQNASPKAADVAASWPAANLETLRLMGLEPGNKM
jgi:aminoglycoside phosphotransferase (APT) family kinase protein